MPRTTTPSPSATRAPAPTVNPPEEDLDETDMPDDVPPAGTRPALSSDEASLVAVAKRRLGLPEDATPMDMLRAIAGSSVERLRPAGPPRAACRIVTVHEGKRLTIEPEALIPEGVDLTKLPPDSVKVG